MLKKGSKTILENNFYPYLTEGMTAGGICRVDKGLKADLTHEVLVNVLAVVVDVGLVVGVVLPTVPEQSSDNRQFLC